MRTTVNLPADLQAEVDRLRREEGLGTSEALVTLARRGLRAAPTRERFVQRTHSLGARIDVSDIGQVLDVLDEDDRLP